MEEQGEGQAAGAKSTQLHPSRIFWKERVNEWYPKWREKSYFIPPVLMYRTDHDIVEISGEDVKVPKPPAVTLPRGATPTVLESDAKDDMTQQRVLHCLRKLSEKQKEVMFVLSNLWFEDYLNEPCFASAAETLPRPIDLKRKKQHRGDFDILVIHRHYGILTCEVKSVGAGFSSHSLVEQETLIAKKIQQAIKQLNKSGDVLNHLVSDIPHSPQIRKSLILPNVPKTQLRQTLTNFPKLAKDLSQCLGIQSSLHPVSLCVTSNQLSNIANPHDVNDEVIRQLGKWWEARMSVNRAYPYLSDDSYLELLTRFSGPATTIKVFCSVRPRLSLDLVRTRGEGASEAKKRFTQIMLTPQQVAVQQSSRPLVYLAGPPGVGKTLMLFVKALNRLRRGLHVHIVSTWDESVAASHNLVHQLKQAVELEVAERIHLHLFHLSSHFLDQWRGEKEIDHAVKVLVEAAAREEGLLVIVDEARVGKTFTDMIEALHEKVPALHLWAACMHHKSKPRLLTEIILTQALRTPPSVTREVQLCDWMRDGGVLEYSVSSCPPPCDGPDPMHLYHAGEGHDEGVIPADCQLCGVEVARLLREDLHVGVTVSGRPAYANQPALQFRDVFVLSYYAMSETRGFVDGLRVGGLPVTVLPLRDDSAVVEVATMARDEVVVTRYGDIHGLERAVVVWVAGGKLRPSGDQWNDERQGRLFAVSRCTAQLVCVSPP